MVRRRARDQSGQAMVEYLLLMSMAVAFYFALSSALAKTKLTENLTRGIKETYARTYQYGHPQAKGYPEDGPHSEGGPVMHPRIVTGDNQNFRIFINPGESN